MNIKRNSKEHYYTQVSFIVKKVKLSVLANSCMSHNNVNYDTEPANELRNTLCVIWHRLHWHGLVIAPQLQLFMYLLNCAFLRYVNWQANRYTELYCIICGITLLAFNNTVCSLQNINDGYVQNLQRYQCNICIQLRCLTVWQCISSQLQDVCTYTVVSN